MYILQSISLSLRKISVRFRVAKLYETRVISISVSKASEFRKKGPTSLPFPQLFASDKFWAVSATDGIYKYLQCLAANANVATALGSMIYPIII